jgi:hypothetical protein
MITCLVLLLTFLSLHPSDTFARPPTKTFVCEYQEKRKPVPINPKTNKPYTPDERNQEPFAGASISKKDIKQCLRATQTIKNHHIVFKEYRKAWQELTEELGKYDTPLFIEGGVLHAETSYERDEKTDGYVSSIDLWAFRDPTLTKDVSQLTEEERKTLGITQKDTFIVFIRPLIKWEKIFIDTVVSARREKNYETRQEITRLIFSNKISFYRTIFSDEADFRNATFGAEVDFSYSAFSNYAYFLGDTFNEMANFSYSTFRNYTYFYDSTFRDQSYFFGSIFSKLADFKRVVINNQANFSYTTFSEQAEILRAIFINLAYFNDASFNKLADFSNTTFSKQADFRRAIFKDNADFRDMRVEETLTFDDTTWERRVDLRGMRAQELHWDSKEHTSEVKGVFDLRQATIGSAVFNEVRFQDIVDFSRTNFCPELLGPLTKEQMEAGQQSLSLCYPCPGVHLDNNTFEKEADFLHVTFGGPALLINNRFRSTLDLTGALFTTSNANLCLSFNRISRIKLGPESFGHPPSFSPFDQFKSLFGTSPLQKSRIRPIAFKKTSAPENNVAPLCVTPYQQGTRTDNTAPQGESLDAIYKMMGQSFRETNDQGGVNEAWYLQTIAKRAQTITTWDTIWAWISWVFGDIPSRYAVDVWRTVWISVKIMFVFWLVYTWILWRLVRSNVMAYQALQVPSYAERQRAFRLRLFEPIHRTSLQRTRRIKPLRDALALSFRAFTKIGLGTIYPNTWKLTILTWFEWLLGVYMLIHFILAVKNNLPFIAPFLGVVN